METIGKRQFLIATEEEIRAGRTSDVYFRRSLDILEKLEVRKRVTAEVVAKGFPRDWGYAVFAGLEEAARLFAPLGVKVWAVPEGTLFLPSEPVLVIEGEYREFGLFETALLGFICQASGVATAAARYRRAAEDRLLFSFGARRMHPAITPMLERSAFIGGCDGVSAMLGAELLGESPAGTMPHALILILGDTVEAARAFDAHIPPEVNRVVASNRSVIVIAKISLLSYSPPPLCIPSLRVRYRGNRPLPPNRPLETPGPEYTQLGDSPGFVSLPDACDRESHIGLLFLGPCLSHRRLTQTGQGSGQPT